MHERATVHNSNNNNKVASSPLPVHLIIATPAGEVGAFNRAYHPPQPSPYHPSIPLESRETSRSKLGRPSLPGGEFRSYVSNLHYINIIT